jgi:hybrid cluster-associated redox disulfide protein
VRIFVGGQRTPAQLSSTFALEGRLGMFIETDDLVDDIMSEWPQTIEVFLRFRMRCVGCPIACFHTVDDACREHGVDRLAFLQALRAAA